MKIERLSENQIRCTLTKADLADKELLLTELAYGTDKAKELFRELMQQASNELGFEVDNIPLMIEAIPVSQDCLILIITKVEDPEELDTRFSRFTKPVEVSMDEEEESDDDLGFEIHSKDDELSQEALKNPFVNQLVGALGSLTESIGFAKRNLKGNNKQEKGQKVTNQEVFRIYAFKSLDQVILSSKLVQKIYNSENTLYKNQQDSMFYLYMTKNNNTDGEFIRACNIISEYGNKIRASYATPSYMDEHYKLIIDGEALQKLSQL